MGRELPTHLFVPSGDSSQSISQSSHSQYGRSLSGQPGPEDEWEITGTQTQSASAVGSADSIYHSQWSGSWTYTGSGYGSTDASGGTNQTVTHDDFDYDYSDTITYNANGSTSNSPTIGVANCDLVGELDPPHFGNAIHIAKFGQFARNDRFETHARRGDQIHRHTSFQFVKGTPNAIVQSTLGSGKRQRRGEQGCTDHNFAVRCLWGCNPAD